MQTTPGLPYEQWAQPEGISKKTKIQRMQISFLRVSCSTIVCENGHTSIYTFVILQTNICSINHRKAYCFDTTFVTTQLGCDQRIGSFSSLASLNWNFMKIWTFSIYNSCIQSAHSCLEHSNKHIHIQPHILINCISHLGHKYHNCGPCMQFNGALNHTIIQITIKEGLIRCWAY